MNKLKISDEHRRVIFDLTGKEEKLLPVMHTIFQHVYCDFYFTWLKAKGLFGSHLWEWLSEKHNGNTNSMLRFIDSDFKRNGLKHAF